MAKIGIIGGALAPNFNEAMANQILMLSAKLNAKVITTNDIGSKIYLKNENYIIINSRFLVSKNWIFSSINGAFVYFVIKYYETKFSKILIPGGIDSIFLNYLNKNKCIPIITSIPSFDENFIQKIKNIDFPKIIVQSNKTKKQIISCGIDENKIELLYPLFDFSKYEYTEPIQSEEFRILFASSPNIELLEENNFYNKGVPLLLEAFREFLSRVNKAKLIIVWRNRHNMDLEEKLEELSLNKYVEIINENTDMVKRYKESHITVIPYVNLKRSPELPLSALESIACGRPVVTTNVVSEVADIVNKHNCGVSSAPNKIDLCEGLQEIQRNYISMQLNCLKARTELNGLNNQFTTISPFEG